VDDLLIKADRMTMAHSVELRVPFLDHRVIEFAATIPSSMKIRGRAVKWILKRAMKDRLPRAILARKKMGFPTPVGPMLQRDLSGYLRELLLSPASLGRGYFKPQVVQTLIEENTRGIRDHHRILWQLVVLEEWHRQFIDYPFSDISAVQPLQQRRPRVAGNLSAADRSHVAVPRIDVTL
jgi:asparagine synthase (glutamine-hydrolysing)